MIKNLVILATILIGIATAAAQDLSQIASAYNGENGKGYMQPLGDCFGAALSSGLNQTAQIHRSGLHIRFGLHTMTALVSDDQKTFTAKTQGDFSPEQTADAPTIFGSTEGASVVGVAGTGYLFPGGLDIDRLPIAVPQVTIGSLRGTELVVRFIQMDLDDNFKELSLTGYGLRHSISQYVKTLPVDIAAAFFMQNFHVGDIVKASTLYYGVQVSKKFGILTLYGGIGGGNAETQIEYVTESKGDPETISFDLDSKTSIRFSAGYMLQAGPLFLHTDFNFGSSNVLALGLGFCF
ncbi:MAG: hypothetical protein EHM72_19770 [Calditrichaeota bacterium]|nr:MAG: hypothetical protein EHM72_19770 [Calditrichota bacterium]